MQSYFFTERGHICQNFISKVREYCLESHLLITILYTHFRFLATFLYFSYMTPIEFILKSAFNRMFFLRKLCLPGFINILLSQIIIHLLIYSLNKLGRSLKVYIMSILYLGLKHKPFHNCGD